MQLQHLTGRCQQPVVCYSGGSCLSEQHETETLPKTYTAASHVTPGPLFGCAGEV